MVTTLSGDLEVFTGPCTVTTKRRVGLTGPFKDESSAKTATPHFIRESVFARAKFFLIKISSFPTFRQIIEVPKYYIPGAITFNKGKF